MVGAISWDGALQAAVAAIAIVVSGVIAVAVPWNDRRKQQQRENRARLNITTTVWEPAGLQLELAYKPEFTHVGLSGRLRLIEPRGVLKTMYMVSNPPLTDLGHLRFELGGAFTGGGGQIRLVRRDVDSLFGGAIVILPPGGAHSPADALKRARVEVQVVTDDGEQLLKTKLTVTPIDRERSYWDIPAEN